MKFKQSKLFIAIACASIMLTGCGGIELPTNTNNDTNQNDNNNDNQQNDENQNDGNNDGNDGQNHNGYVDYNHLSEFNESLASDGSHLNSQGFKDAETGKIIQITQDVKAIENGNYNEFSGGLYVNNNNQIDGNVSIMPFPKVYTQQGVNVKTWDFTTKQWKTVSAQDFMNQNVASQNQVIYKSSLGTWNALTSATPNLLGQLTYSDGFGVMKSDMNADMIGYILKEVDLSGQPIYDPKDVQFNISGNIQGNPFQGKTFSNGAKAIEVATQTLETSIQFNSQNTLGTVSTIQEALSMASNATSGANIMSGLFCEDRKNWTGESYQLVLPSYTPGAQSGSLELKNYNGTVSLAGSWKIETLGGKKVFMPMLNNTATNDYRCEGWVEYQNTLVVGARMELKDMKNANVRFYNSVAIQDMETHFSTANLTVDPNFQQNIQYTAQ